MSMTKTYMETLDAEVLLCAKHLGRAIAIINAQTAAVRQSAKATR